MTEIPADGWTHAAPGPDDDAAADALIRRRVVQAMLAGAIPFPLVDLAVVTGVQLGMLEELARVYRAPLDSRSTRALLASVSSALLGTVAGRAALSVFKIVPIVGWIGGGMAQVVTTGAVTYAVGQVYARLFRERRPLEDLDAATVLAELQLQMERGREVASALYREARRARRG